MTRLYDGPQYWKLIASLPELGRDFAMKRPPISRVRLDARLAELRPEHRDAARDFEDIMRWTRQPVEAEDEAILARHDAVLEKWSNPTLQAILRGRFELRTLFAALRRRRRGQGPPADVPRWGTGPWRHRIKQNWERADFGLAAVYPFLPALAQAFHEDDPVAIERQLLEIAWHRLDRIGATHFFDFDAVLVYLARWDIVDRWVRTVPEEAIPRFDGLLDEGMGEYGQLFDAA